MALDKMWAVLTILENEMTCEIYKVKKAFMKITREKLHKPTVSFFIL